MLETKTTFETDFKIEKSRIQTILDARPTTKRHDDSTNKALIYILIFSWMFLAIVAVSFQKKYTRDVKVLREKILVVLNSKAMLQNSLKNAVRAKRGYKVSFQQETKRSEELTTQLMQLINSEIVNNKKLDLLYYKLNKINLENSGLKEEIQRLFQEKERLQAQVVSLQRTQKNLQEKIKRLLTRTKIELGELVVTPSNITGRILKANRNYNFVIIDLGRNDGLQRGMNLTAYRQEKRIGTITIEKVYDELSVGKAAFKWIGSELKTGDSVRGAD